MYLDGYDEHELNELHGIGSKLKKSLKKARKAVSKVAKSAVKVVTKTNPVMAIVNRPKTLRKVAEKTVRFTAKVNPVVALHKAGAKNKKMLIAAAVPALAIASKPLSYVARGQPQIAPEVTVPDVYVDGSEITQAERDAVIEAAAPRYEPYASGYPSPEESFGPDAPGIVEPEDLQPEPPAQTAQKKSALPWIGGALLLLNLLS